MSESTQPIESGDSGERPNKSDPIARFKTKYDEALATAKVSAEHTMTEGWLSLYSAERRIDREARRQLAELLKSTASVLADFGSNEDLEKQLGDVKKEALALRERREAFEATTVAPVKQPATDCEKVIEEAKREARRLESEAPLIHRGVEAKMQKAISAVARASWDEDRGSVIVTAPGKASMN